MKRFLLIFLAVAFMISFSACKPGAPEEPEAPPPEATEDGGVTYADPSYLPIVSSPVTLSATITANGSRGDYADRSLWAEVEAKTGIKIEIRTLVTSGAGETAALLFAARDYPDISFRIDTGNWQILLREAAAAGDIVELTDEMLEKFAPNWFNIFKENPDIYSLSVHPDGKLYGLPHIFMEDHAIYFRDCQFINADWLDELGMAMPKTLDDFKGYLRAVKNAAGTGSIPSNVIPLYIRNMVNIGGWYSFADMFGVWNGLAGEIVVDGVVKNNAQNEELKLPVKWLASLYGEGLWSTASYSTYDQFKLDIDQAGGSNKPWFIGSFFDYERGVHLDFLEFLPPMTAIEGKAPLVRTFGLGNRILEDNFFIFTGCKYPVAALRLMDTYADAPGTLRMEQGEEGYVYLKTEDGSYVKRTETIETVWEKAGLGDYGPGFIDSDTMKMYASEQLKDQTTRISAYESIYKQYVPDNMVVFETDALKFLTAEEQAEATAINTKVSAFVNTIVRKWLINGSDIDADWDEMQKKLVDLGLNRKLELYQKAWNLYTSFTVD